MPNEMTYARAGRIYNKTVTIADSASQPTDGVDLGDETLCGVIVPSTWSTAAISFLAATTLTGTYYPLYSASGAEVVTGSITGGTAVWVALDPADFAGVRYLKVRSGTSAAAVNQSGGDTLTLVTRAV